MISGSQRKLKINNNLAFRLILNPKFMFRFFRFVCKLAHFTFSTVKKIQPVEFLTQPEQRS